MTAEPYMPLPPEQGIYTRPLGEVCSACGFPLEHELCRRCAASWLRDNRCWRCGSPVEDGACIEAGHMIWSKRDVGNPRG